MKFKKVIIKVIEEELIKEDEVWKYKNHRCHCGCKERIPYRESNKSNGVPQYINGHYMTGKIFSEEVCKNMSKGKTGITFSEEHCRNISKGKNGIPNSEEHCKNISKARKEWALNNPEALLKSINNLLKSRKNKDTKLELFIQDYVRTITNEQFVTDATIPDYDRNKFYKVDLLLLDSKTIIESNGCYPHRCINCHPLSRDDRRDAEKRRKDRRRIIRLKQLGFKVIVIWEHDKESGEYKKILKNIIK